MQRLRQVPRNDWPARLAEVGFHFHSIDEDGRDHPPDATRFRYWREDAAFKFDAGQVETLYEAANELHAMCVDAVDDAVRAGDPSVFAVPPGAWPLVESSWRAREPSLFGRFDLAWGGTGAPKLLEYNADTPTSLVESSLAQWQWVTQTHPGADQFNGLHEALIERWGEIREWHLARPGAGDGAPTLHLACLFESQEDVGNTEYLMDLAVQAGWQAKILDVGAIGVDDAGQFCDAQARTIDTLFKLYPWEWLVREAFAAQLHTSQTCWIEPPWKMLLSTKAILPELWKLSPGHPNLLESYYEGDPAASNIGRDYVAKPIFSREGANVEIRRGGVTVAAPEGPYDTLPRVIQALAPEVVFDRMRPVIGSWIIDQDPAGIGIREDAGLVTGNASCFVPHAIVD
jgi:glutathionylspermidine synthase